MPPGHRGAFPASQGPESGRCTAYRCTNVPKELLPAVPPGTLWIGRGGSRSPAAVAASPCGSQELPCSACTHAAGGLQTGGALVLRVCPPGPGKHAQTTRSDHRESLLLGTYLPGAGAHGAVVVQARTIGGKRNSLLRQGWWHSSPLLLAAFVQRLLGVPKGKQTGADLRRVRGGAVSVGRTTSPPDTAEARPPAPGRPPGEEVTRQRRAAGL